MKFFNLDRINQKRKELMGISAIGILAVHAIRKEVVMPAILQHILSLGGYGVDIFILLSGIGMAFSTDKISGGGYWKWYKHRFLRIVVPSLIVIIPARIILCILSGESLSSIPWFLTTIPFWTQHNGDWFLDFIIVAYLFAPPIRMVYDRAKLKLLVTVGLCILFVLVGNSFFGLLKTDSQVWYNASYVAQRFPGFFIGYYIAYLMKEKKGIPYWVTVIGPMICILFWKFDIDIHFGWILSIPSVIWLCTVFDWIKEKTLHNVLAWFGTISLESYLMNVYIANILTYTGIQKIFNGYLYYGVVVVMGIILAAAVNKVVKQILLRINTLRS